MGGEFAPAFVRDWVVRFAGLAAHPEGLRASPLESVQTIDPWATRCSLLVS